MDTESKGQVRDNAEKPEQQEAKPELSTDELEHRSLLGKCCNEERMTTLDKLGADALMAL